MDCYVIVGSGSFFWLRKAVFRALKDKLFTVKAGQAYPPRFYYSCNELIIWKMNLLVVPVIGVKFKATFLHA